MPNERERMTMHPKCHKEIDTKTSNDYVKDVVDWVFKNKMLRDKFEHLIADFLQDKQISEFEMGLLSDAFIFDYKLPENNLTPFEYFMEKSQQSDQDRIVYEGFNRSSYSMFEVLDVKRGEGLKLKDLINQREYWVKEKMGTCGTIQGNIVVCRVAPFRNYFVLLGSGMLSGPRDVGYIFKRNLKYIREATKKKPLTAFDVLRCLIGAESKTGKSLEDVKRALEKKLGKLGIKVDFQTLTERINKSKSPQEAFPEIFDFDFPSNQDYKVTLELLYDLWNNFPRHELDGLTPSEKAEIGPREEMLIHDLIMETQKNIDPNKYPTIDDAQKAADKFKDKWLKTAQNELEHKTPMDVILEERAALGNSDKEFNIQVEISRVPDFDLNEAEKLYHEGAKAFKNGSIIKAVELFGEVTNMYPESYKAWGNLGRCYASLGNKKEAIRCYKRALSIEPNYEFAKKNLIAIKDLDVSK